MASYIITPATKYIKEVIPAKAGIQAGTGCRIKSGVTVSLFNCRVNNQLFRRWSLVLYLFHFLFFHGKAMFRPGKSPFFYLGLVLNQCLFDLRG